jgi:hypothetical protein
MKVPCELIVTYILPTAKGALAKELVNTHGMTQVQVAKLFGVTSAAVSQYLKGIRGGNSLIDKSAYRDDFYEMIRDMADSIAAGMPVNDALCMICEYVKDCGLLKALYVFEGYSGDEMSCFQCPKYIVDIGCDSDEARL